MGCLRARVMTGQSREHVASHDIAMAITSTQSFAHTVALPIGGIASGKFHCGRLDGNHKQTETCEFCKYAMKNTTWCVQIKRSSSQLTATVTACSGDYYLPCYTNLIRQVACHVCTTSLLLFLCLLLQLGQANSKGQPTACHNISGNKHNVNPLGTKHNTVLSRAHCATQPIELDAVVLMLTLAR